MYFSLLQHVKTCTKANKLYTFVDNSSDNTIIAGRKRRLGFGKRGKNSFTVQRSEEVVPGGGMCGVSRASSASSENDEDRFALLGTHDIDTIVRHLARAVAHSRITSLVDITKVTEKRKRGHLHTYLLLLLTQHVTEIQQSMCNVAYVQSANVELYIYMVKVNQKSSKLYKLLYKRVADSNIFLNLSVPFLFQNMSSWTSC